MTTSPYVTTPLADGSLELEPLGLAHAAEMTRVLGDASLYIFTGGEPPTLASLQQRYVRQSRGISPDGTEAWFNWIIRDLQSRDAAGFVQASVPLTIEPAVASLAWLVNPGHQGRGLATRATRLMMDALHTQGVTRFRASIADGHAASERVAERVGMHPTDERDDEEVVWRL